MHSYTIRPNEFLQQQDVFLSRSRALRQPAMSASLHEDLLAVAALWRQTTSAFAQSWDQARARRRVVQQLKPIDPRLLADVGIDYPNLRDVVDTMVAHQAKASPPTGAAPDLEPAFSAGP